MDNHDLEVLFKTQHPIIVIESHEEKRLLQLISRIGIQQYKPVYQWTITDGLKRLDIDITSSLQKADEEQVLRQIREEKNAGIYILCDYHAYLENPVHVRLLKDIAQEYERNQITLVLLSHQIEIPPELLRLSASAVLALPTQKELEKIVLETANEWRKKTGTSVQSDPESFKLLLQNLSGLTVEDARRLARVAIFDDGAINADDLPQVMKAKHRLLRGDDVLSIEFDTARFADVGGLHSLKQWLEQRKPAFLGESKNGSLEPPRGMLLLGVQGGGKSMAAKATAAMYNVPLLRLDFAAIYNKYHGETERNLRESLKTAESMSPCVLWIDEIEKGISSSDSDGGTSQRVLGTLLTWMAEKKTPVFLVATANDIERLPAELIRKGRFDEIFFIDLPDTKVRQEIFAIHLHKRELTPTRFDTKMLANQSEGFSGAEIEQVIVSALYANHALGGDLETQQLLEEILRTKPLSVVMREKVAHLRQWAAERTVPAS
jgi:ATP-dependent 26S proteasome regulatory subunit